MPLGQERSLSGWQARKLRKASRPKCLNAAPTKAERQRSFDRMLSPMSSGWESGLETLSTCRAASAGLASSGMVLLEERTEATDLVTVHDDLLAILGFHHLVFLHAHGCRFQKTNAQNVRSRLHSLPARRRIGQSCRLEPCSGLANVQPVGDVVPRTLNFSALTTDLRPRAAANPALVRSPIKSRLNWPNTLNT